MENKITNSKQVQSAKMMPVPQRLFVDLTKNFNWFYKFGNTNSGFDEIPNLKINVGDMLTALSINANDLLGNTPNTDNANGILLDYIIDSDAGGYFFTYLIYKGDMHGNPASNKYAIERNGTIRQVTTAQSNTLKDYYLDNIHINHFSDQNRDILRNLTIGINQGHPTRCFHSFKILYLFFKSNETYIAPLGPILNTVFIFITNGAIYMPIDAPNTNDYKLQTPILSFGIGLNMRVLDDDFNSDRPFENKALDIGRLCPTEC